MSLQVEDKFSQLYQSMFQAKQSGDHVTADALMATIEKLRSENQASLDSALVNSEVEHLPDFAQQVLGRSQTEIGKTERSNCINAAFNYHDVNAHWDTYSTMDFLSRIQKDFVQIDRNAEVERGDLVVLWSRTGGSWDDRAIDVHQMNHADRDFPYGLVFDHIAVRLNRDVVFHKPDPTHSSRYQIESMDAIKAHSR